MNRLELLHSSSPLRSAIKAATVAAWGSFADPVARHLTLAHAQVVRARHRTFYFHGHHNIRTARRLLVKARRAVRPCVCAQLVPLIRKAEWELEAVAAELGA